MEIKDLEGNVVKPGDRVAAAFRIRNVAVLRTGTVLGFGERSNSVTVRVEWDHDSSFDFATHPLATRVHGAIDASLTRFVKIGD